MTLNSPKRWSGAAWAFAFVLLGVACFGMAMATHSDKVQAALISCGTGLIMGGFGVYQREETVKDESKPPADAPVTEVPPVDVK